MNCLGCGYRLWNLPPGACPECGRPFKPSDFEFQPNAVQFVCPHCTQVYYGTDERGQLVPRAFNCVTCHQPLQIDEMLVRPDGAVEEDATPKRRNAWVDRRRVGFLRGWFTTIGHSMVFPPQLIAATPLRSTADAVSFFAITTFAYLLVGCIPWAVLMIVIGISGGPGDLLEMLGVAGAFVVGPMLVLAAFVLLEAAVAHGVLRLSGPTEHGFGRTLQCVCYGGGANCSAAIPCLNMHFFWVGMGWWLVSSILMLVRGQGVSGWRAAGSVLLLPAMLLAGMIVGVFFMVRTTTAQVQALHASLVQSSATNLATALQTYAAGHGGNGPAHAAELMVAGSVTPHDFGGSGGLDYAAIAVGSGTLLDFYTLAATDQARLAAEAAAALPADVVAHRLGEFVFTYHGVTLDPPTHPDLWVAIYSPIPTSNVFQPQEPVVVTASGASRTILTADFPQELQAQNALRQSHGLAPLPMPDTVLNQPPAATP